MGAGSWSHGDLHRHRGQLYFAGVDSRWNLYGIRCPLYLVMAVVWRLPEVDPAGSPISTSVQLYDGHPADGFSHPGIYRSLPAVLQPAAGNLVTNCGASNFIPCETFTLR